LVSFVKPFVAIMYFIFDAIDPNTVEFGIESLTYDAFVFY
jgi:uncharacterized membrane protein